MVIDASVLVSYFVPADVFHAETVTWLDAALNSGERFVAPMLLLPEVAGAIARRSLKPEVGLKAAQETLTWPTLRLLPLDDMLMQLAMGIAATLKMKGADALYVAVAQLHNTTLVTWDREQQARGSLLVSALSPKPL